MDWQWVINLLIGAVIALGGFIVKLLHGELQLHGQKIDDINKNLPAIYVRKDDFREVMDRIDKSLVRIEDKLDKKANIRNA